MGRLRQTQKPIRIVVGSNDATPIANSVYANFGQVIDRQRHRLITQLQEERGGAPATAFWDEGRAREVLAEDCKTEQMLIEEAPPLHFPQ